jgi:small subunit ribosomal protein S4
MIHGPKYKLCRRLGSHVFEKCQTQKFVQSEAKKGAMKKGKRPKALSDFGTQLLEKQRIRFSYGVSEKQFSNYVKKATHGQGSATEKLYEALEVRLDNVVYRLGLAHTRALARQVVSHGHITVNGVKTRVPSYQVKIGDKISIRDGSKKSTLFNSLETKLKDYSWPNWLKFDIAKGEAVIEGKPRNADGVLNFNTVLEYYSR